MTNFRSSWVAMIAVSVLAGGCAGLVMGLVAVRTLNDVVARAVERRASVPATPRQTALDAVTAAQAVAATVARADARAILLPVAPVSRSLQGWRGVPQEGEVGVVMSENGWVLVRAAALPTAQSVARTEVLVAGERYAIAEIVRDTASPFALLHLENAQRLAAAPIGEPLRAATGDLLVRMGARTVEAAALVATDAPLDDLLVRPAEDAGVAWRVPGVAAGEAIWDSRGNLLGLAIAEDMVMSLVVAGDFLDDAVRGAPNDHAALGATVVDIARVTNMDPLLTQGQRRGALILSTSRTSLRVHDLLLAVDAVPITSAAPLAWLLADYDPGTIANLTVLRDGETLTVPVELDDAETVQY